MATYTTGIPATIVLRLICFYSIVYGEDYDERQGRLLRKSENKFQCESEGFHADPYDCSLFYRCIDWGESSENSLQSRFTSFQFQCGGGSVFDPDTNACVHASESSRSGCRNEFLEPLLFNIPRAEALQSTDRDSNGPDYGVVQSQGYNPPPTPQQPSYANKPGTEHQIEPVAEVDNTIAAEPMPPRVTRSPPCSAEGFFPIENDCAHFYRCVSNGKGFTKYEFSCGEGTVWDPDNNACNHAWAVQRTDCKSTGQGINEEGINQVEDNNTNLGPEPAQQENSNPSAPSVDQNSTPASGLGQSTPENPNAGYPGNEQGANNGRPPNNNQPTNGMGQSTPENPNAGYPGNEQGPNNGGPPNNNQPANGSGKNDSCPSEGFHPVMNDCKKFIRCVNNGNGGYIKYEFECAEGTVWDIDSVTCNYPYAVQRSDCKTDSNSVVPDQNGPSTANPNQPSTSGFDQGTVAQSPYPTGQTSSTSSQQSSSTNSQQSSSANHQTSSTSSQQSSSSSSHQTSSSSSQSQTSSSGFNQQQGSTSGSNFQTTSSWQGSSSGQGSSTGSNSQTTSSQQSSTSGSNQQGSTSGSSSQTTSSGQQSSGTTNAGNTQTTSTGQQGSNSGSTSGSNSQTTSSTSGSAQQGSASGQTQTTSSNQQGSTGAGSQTTSGSQGSTSSSNQQGASTGSSSQTSSGQSSMAGSNQQGSQTSSTGSNQQGTSSGNYQGTSTGQGSTTSSNQQGSSTGSSSQGTSNGYGSGSSSGQQGSQSTASSQQTTGTENAGNSSHAANQNKADVCSAEGFFPSSKNCNKFYRCVKNEGTGYSKYEFSCGPGTVWDPDNNVCNHPWAVQNGKCRSESESTSPGPEAGSNTSPSTNYTSPQPSSSTTPAYATLKPSNGNESSTTKPMTAMSTPTKPSVSSTSKPTSPTTSKNETTTRPPTGTVSSTKSPTNTSPGLTSSPTTTNKNETTTPTARPSPGAISSTDRTPPNSSTNGGNTNEPTGNTTAGTGGSTTPQYNNETSSPLGNTTTPSGTSTTCENGTSTKPANKITCTKAGFYPHPDDCKKFYRCVDWDGDKGQRFSVYYFDCPAGTIFDPSLDTCNHENSVYPPRDCGKTNASQTTDASQKPTDSAQLSTNSTENPAANITSPSESTPNEGTTSATTEPYTDQTTPGSETSPANGTLTTINSTPGSTDAATEENTAQTTQAVTNSPAVTTAESGSTTNPATITTPEESSTGPASQITTSGSTGAETTTISSTSPSETCPELGPDQFALVCPTGFRRHPKYCNVFYQCTTAPNGEIKVLTLSCTNGTVYDDKKIQCLPPEQAKKCDGSMMDTRFLRQMNDNSLPPVPVKSDKTICPNEGTFSYKEDCRLFYKCKKDNEGNLNGYIYQCPEGFSYWNISKRCEKSEKVPCEGGRKSTPITKSSLAPVEMKNIGHK